MSWQRALLTGLLLVEACSTARAEFFGGNDLKSKLENWETTASSGDYRPAAEGAGYVIGVHDAFTNWKVCSPANVKVGQVVSVVLKFIRQNPEALNMSADQLVLKSLRAEWPCGENQSSAPFLTGNNVKAKLEEWDQNANSPDGWMAVGYVLGVHDALDRVLVCTPTTVTVGQVSSVALKYMRQEPEHLDDMGSKVIFSGLTRVWPCKAHKKAPGNGQASVPNNQQVSAPVRATVRSKPKTDTTDSPF